MASDYCIGYHSSRETQPELGAAGTAMGTNEIPYWQHWMHIYWIDL